MMKKAGEKLNTLLLAKEISVKFIKDPLFMFICPVKAKRADFIEKYFAYYLNQWDTGSEIIIDENKKCIATLTDPKHFKYSFWGKNSLPLKMSKYSGNILNHQEIVQEIINIVVPEAMNKRLLTIYAAPDVSADDINKIIKTCQERAKKENFVLVYETLSKRFISLFEAAGFETGYARQFINTQFFQTVMTFNI